MWNLEQTEQRILRFTPVVFIVMVLLLIALHLTLEPQKLAPIFAPPGASVLEQSR